MKNGLYSIHLQMLDGVKGRDSSVLVLRDGVLLGGGPHYWSEGSYTVGNGTWKGELRTNQHTPFADRFLRPLFGEQEVTSGFTGTFAGDQAEAFGTTLVGNRSLSFHATLKWLADSFADGVDNRFTSRWTGCGKAVDDAGINGEKLWSGGANHGPQPVGNRV